MGPYSKTSPPATRAASAASVRAIAVVFVFSALASQAAQNASPSTVSPLVCVRRWKTVMGFPGDTFANSGCTC